jgi:protein-tyrosine phosphatase
MVDWLVTESGPLIEAAGQVGLSSCPGRTDLGGDVPGDVQHLLSLGIGVVVSLVSDSEMEYYGVVGLRPALRAAGIHSVQFPLQDTQPPRDLHATQALCRSLLGWLGEGTHVLIHCIGGWGRSGTIAASLLTHQGYAPETAISLVRQARDLRCVESRAQERFVHEYAKAQAACTRYYFLLPRALVKSGAVLGGRAMARTLLKVHASRGKLLCAAELPDAVNAWQEAGRPEPVILSGELSKTAAGDDDYPVDRAFVKDERGFRAVALPELLRSA